MAVAGEMAAAGAAPGRAVVPVAGVSGRDVRGDGGAAVPRPLPTPAVRLQPRSAALDLAGLVLRLRRPRHGPLPTFQPRRRAGLPGDAGRRLPGAPVPWAGAGEVVAAGDPALPGGRVLRRGWRVRALAVGQRLGRRTGDPVERVRRRGAAVHRPLPARNLRP